MFRALTSCLFGARIVALQLCAPCTASSGNLGDPSTDMTTCASAWASLFFRSSELAVAVAPEYRRQQLAKKLMIILEDITEKTYNGYFVGLFVRASNHPAVTMYQKLSYSVTEGFLDIIQICEKPCHEMYKRSRSYP